MGMPKVRIAGRDVLLNVVHHDSGEHPESACTNVLIAAMVGGVTYQHLNVEPDVAVGRIVGQLGVALLANPLVPVPPMLTVVISKFYQSMSIDWKGAVSALARMEVYAATAPRKQVAP
ncbi:hypothetical protein [Duganella vulcania]|uniref:Uncharacterized protein n=1 Tax=Duganella vulcania TaxID=2692166 RepID=A0A845GHI3_9BURK|nr:hypothetical protein [Duganella vulcania]MYM92488.1 hypothetical protein [Duganella vulcania]